MGIRQDHYPPAIDVQTVKSVQDVGEEDFLLVDCREPDEHRMAHIRGAKLLPMAETLLRIAELEPYRDKRIVVHCHHGMRSQQVVQFLRERGFYGAQNMTGGIDAWAVIVDSQMQRY